MTLTSDSRFTIMVLQMSTTSKIQKTQEGIFIPRELIPDFERVDVDASTPGVIIISSRKGSRHLDGVLERIDRRREIILGRRGPLADSIAIIRESRERELE
jgi:hypothetical protein